MVCGGMTGNMSLYLESDVSMTIHTGFLWVPFLDLFSTLPSQTEMNRDRFENKPSSLKTLFFFTNY